jgi:hypothetical protein
VTSIVDPGQLTFGPSVIQSPRVIESAWAVARFGEPSLPEVPAGDWRQIRRGYLSALNAIQNHPFPNSMISDDVVFDFGDGPESEAALKELLDTDPLPEGWQVSPDEQDAMRDAMVESLAWIDRLDPDLHRNMRVVVAGFIVARRPNLEGGSISALMGPIWLDPAADWIVYTYVENMVHEYVHQCLFLDEMVHTIFSRYSVDEMSTPDALVTSTILKRRRPYDKAYHSAFVSHVLAQLYLQQSEDQKARGYLESTRSTTDELLERPEFASPNGMRLLRELSDEVDQLLARA